MPSPAGSESPTPYDIAIIGAGPAGLAAGLYAIRSGRSVLCLEQYSAGGQAATTWQVDNYPGIPSANGAELMMKMDQQVRDLGLSMVYDQVSGLIPGELHQIQGADKTYLAKSVIIATGAVPLKLNIPGEAEFRGKGVSYCATCDGAFFRDVPIAVVGGGNSALEEADYLTRFASKVYIVHRREQFRADRSVQEHVMSNPKIELVTPFVPYRILGDAQGVKSLEIGPRNEKECRSLEVRGVFVFVGIQPQTGIFKSVLETDEHGYLRTNADLETRFPGIFVAGDCRANKVKQIVVAAGEGATAAILADRYLQIIQAKHKGRNF